MKENTLNRSPFVFRRFKTLCTCSFAICCLVLAFGCKTKKPLAARKPVVDTVTVAKAVDTKMLKINAIKSAQTAFSTFSGKARTKLTINGETNDVTLNVRILHDKKIWVSITAIAGIEAARVLITPDSIMLINRLQDLYIRQPFSYINKYAGDQVNYQMIESMLIGNAIPQALTKSSDIKPDGMNTVLSGNLAELSYKLILGADNKLNQFFLANSDGSETVQVTNGALLQVGTHVLPSQIDVLSTVKSKKIQVNLHYVKEEFDQPLEFPFSIPARYTPAE